MSDPGVDKARKKERERKALKAAMDVLKVSRPDPKAIEANKLMAEAEARRKARLDKIKAQAK